MASQVISGTNASLRYTNNTGQNVRVIINYLRVAGSATMTAGKMTISPLIVGSSSANIAIGRNLAIDNGFASSTGFFTGNNGIILAGGILGAIGLPTEVMLEPNELFSVTGNSTYNIVVIPEAG